MHGAASRVTEPLLLGHGDGRATVPGLQVAPWDQRPRELPPLAEPSPRTRKPRRSAARPADAMRKNAALALAVLALGCGRSFILDDDEGGTSGRGSGATGGGGGSGASDATGGAGGSGACAELSSTQPVTLLPENYPQNIPRMAISSETEGRVSVVYFGGPGPVPELRHSFVWPWSAWPPTTGLSSLIDAAVMLHANVAPWSTNRIALLYARAAGGVYYAGPVNPVLTTPPTPTLFDGAGIEATFLAGRELSHVGGSLRQGVSSLEHVVRTIGVDAGGTPVFGAEHQVACGSPSAQPASYPVGDAVSISTGWLIASSTGAPGGQVSGCAPNSVASSIQLFLATPADTVTVGARIDVGVQLANLRWAPASVGAWLFWITRDNALVVVHGARVNEAAEILEGPFDVSPPSLGALTFPLAACAFDDGALVGWTTAELNIAVRRVSGAADLGAPSIFRQGVAIPQIELASRAAGDFALLAWDDGSNINLTRLACAP